MKISINDKQGLLADDAVLKAHARINASFAKYSNFVKSIELTIRDINGPRGGVDKECQLLVRLRKLNDIAVTTRNESSGKALLNGIDRASRTVGRALDRRVRTFGNHPLRIGFN
jgi:hypothetical protein